MSSGTQTKIFGMRVGVNPKILVFALVAVAGGLFWYNSRSDDSPGAGSAARATTQSAPVAGMPAAAKTRPTRPRHTSSETDRGTLRVRPIDAASGDVDPTLRLGLLSRLQSVALPEHERNVFEAGQEPAEAQALPVKAPKIVPDPLPPSTPPITNPGPPPLNIPLKYYGFAKSASNKDPNSGFFLDGDNVLVASEGEVLQKRYLVVELTARAAKLEDTQLKRGQMLPVVPEATVQ
ncbi:MAG: hypothetical protein JO319_16940 [Acidobacteriaceae bacterium]|nr:hypothetical protein [Acidobacteriaceae bacterium]